MYRVYEITLGHRKDNNQSLAARAAFKFKTYVEITKSVEMCYIYRLKTHIDIVSRNDLFTAFQFLTHCGVSNKL